MNSRKREKHDRVRERRGGEDSNKEDTDDRAKERER